MDNIYLQRLNLLRAEMKNRNIDICYIPTDDYHLSEYVGDYFKEREYLSGFTGSAGSIIVTEKEAYLYTDGRYFLQAEAQIKNTGFSLMKLGTPNVGTPLSYLKEHLKDNLNIAFDFRVVPFNFVSALLKEKELHGYNCQFVNIDLVDIIWKDRPSISKEKIFILPLKYSGESAIEKINKVRQWMKENNLNAYVISSLESVMYLFNLRGADIKFTPVALSYAVVYLDKSEIYIQNEALNENVVSYLKKNQIDIENYRDFYEKIKNLKGLTVGIDPRNSNYNIISNLENNNQLKFIDDFIIDMKAIKNPVEIKNIKRAHIKDAVAMIKFIYYLKHDKGEKDEISVADKLYSLRKMQKNFVDLSFATIVGFAEHGAIVHYEASEKTNKKIDDNNFLLVDSGGHYLEGTTDITRTVVLGKVTHQMKKDFTNVLKAHIDLAMAKFVKGTTGSQIDMLAREPLFKNYQNFNHGTGHGVGYLLSVHEGPQNISLSRYNNVILKPGMITSDEPGLYIANQYGIRHENLLLIQNDLVNEYGEFYRFEPLTYVMFDLDGIIPSLLNSDEKKYLNDYHKKVYQKVNRYLSTKERRWLKKVTRKI